MILYSILIQHSFNSFEYPASEKNCYTRKKTVTADFHEKSLKNRINFIMIITSSLTQILLPFEGCLEVFWNGNLCFLNMGKKNFQISEYFSIFMV